jgi:hypothetical protein
MDRNLGCVILACSDDLHFLNVTIKEIHPVFSKIIIMFGSQFWNGEPENEDKIEEFTKKIDLYDNIRVMRYDVNKKAPKIREVSDEMYWEGYARYIATINMPLNIDYIVYLDADEVIDGLMFQKWLYYDTYKVYDALKLSNYWYWREPNFRAKSYNEDSVTMINFDFAYKNKEYLFSNLGRHGLYEIAENRKRNIVGIDNRSMIHHYSWVRNKEQMLRKVKNWGHRNDSKDWESKVEEEFSRLFNGTDFVKGLEYEIVADKFGLVIESLNIS